MELTKLIQTIPAFKEVGNHDNIMVKGIAIDHRQVKEGDLFVCIKGVTVDGHNFAPLAVQNGAVALVVERELPIEVPQIIVRNTVRALALLTDRFYNHPTHDLSVIAITGTNGKTTTTNLIEHIFKSIGTKTGLIGTIEARIGDRSVAVKNTTPDSLVLQSLFHDMVNEDVRFAIIEASSHALQMGRLWGTKIKTAIFTNLSQDHLDFHESMEQYREAKGMLFSQLGNAYDKNATPVAILNADDPASHYFAALTAAPIVTYGIDVDADIRATDVKIERDGTTFRLSSYAGNRDVKLRMIGKFNVYNALAAIAACLNEGLSLHSIIDALESIPGVNGRFETVDEGQDYTVIVDYAHTPDSLENVLTAVKQFAKGKVICVFGCGGDRDRTKRPLMGEIAARLSDKVVVTSDNPRSEDPEQIIVDILKGIEESAIVEKETDRREAIHLALSSANKDDVVIIAGKGHETYQIIKGTTHHFDDREVVRDYLRGQN